MTPHELTGPVALTAPDGTLNPDAVGWARHPFVDTSGIGRRPHRAWGRAKRWEYWNVATPTHLVSVTVSSLDYAAVSEVWIVGRATGRSWHEAATVLPSRGVSLPRRLDAGRTTARAKRLRVLIEPQGDVPPDLGRTAASVRLRGAIPGAFFDITVTRPAGHECLAVVVPFRPGRFQYTVKDVALPASGVLSTDGTLHPVPVGDSWAVLDHGRGLWPYDVRWNWGVGSGIFGGRVIGLQMGGQWTRGSGQTENGVVVDGALHKIHDELVWEHDRRHPTSPWHVHGGGLDAWLVPFTDKVTATDLGLLASHTHQCFGHWSGVYTAGTGERIVFRDLLGFGEDVHNRW